mmetsp:Transcript_29779/g.62692  ORF Transcript_29779/g.62692 Transcript_29779/m.62692 type:complete len:212 (-) Transcript_29779:8-643(-)
MFNVIAHGGWGYARFSLFEVDGRRANGGRLADRKAAALIPRNPNLERDHLLKGVVGSGFDSQIRLVVLSLRHGAERFLLAYGLLVGPTELRSYGLPGRSVRAKLVGRILSSHHCGRGGHGRPRPPFFYILVPIGARSPFRCRHNLRNPLMGRAGLSPGRGHSSPLRTRKDPHHFTNHAPVNGIFPPANRNLLLFCRFSLAPVIESPVLLLL